MNPSSPPRRIRILLVDDHVVVRMGLATAIGAEPDMEVVAEANNGVEAMERFRLHRPDVVILDLRMPKQNGLETIQLLVKESLDVRVLVFSSYGSGEEVYQALKAGAAGFVVKEMAPAQLLEVIRKVAAGERYISPEISGRVTERFLSDLTAREMEVLRLVARGLSNKEIGESLGLAENTVKVHLGNILAKLRVADRTQAIIAAVKRGLIDLD